jgi:uridine monophosphate synthetase
MFPGPAIVTALKQAAITAIDSLRHGVSTEIYVGTPHASSEGEDDDYIEGKFATKRIRTHPGRKDSIVANTTIFQTVELSQRRSGSDSSTHARQLQDELLENLGEPPLSRALLLFAQMSSEGNLMDEQYTQHCLTVARQHKDFVIGFISQRDLNSGNSDDFISMTPGVQLPPRGQEGSAVKGDGLGQRYRSPQEVVGKDGCDVVIVGRGIIASKERAKEAERYRDAAWKAYEARIA